MILHTALIYTLSWTIRNRPWLRKTAKQSFQMASNHVFLVVCKQTVSFIGEASPTLWSCNANISVFTDCEKNRISF